MREPNPTEPANYTGSYTAARKEIVGTEIAMSQSADRAVLGTLLRTIITRDKLSRIVIIMFSYFALLGVLYVLFMRLYELRSKA
jgi:hypothetical protein